MAERLAYYCVLFEMHTHIGKFLNFCVYYVARKTELGYAVFQNTADFVQRFEHGYIKSLFDHVAGK